MNILIDTVRIAGFRGISDLEISLSRVTVLIGTNNSGKTSLLKALQLALGDYSRQLSEEDFHIGIDDKRVPEILIDVRIVPVNNDGQRVPLFHEDWRMEFGDKIQAEANGNQYVVVRTRSKKDIVKGGFDTSRKILKTWADINSWKTERIKEESLFSRFESICFMPIEAQRDIHQELKEKSSYIGKILGSIEYEDLQVNALESLIEKVNDQAINQSQELTSLKTTLERLNQSFESSANVEITPFPKKIRDLCKYFSVHLGENTASTFPMEYHGMGTRSWASMLTATALINLKSEKYEQEEKRFFAIFAAEEPEAHLHPNAQKTLYKQLTESKGQVIVSTHSPYLAAIAQQSELRCLNRTNQGISVRSLNSDLEDEDRRKLQREVLHSRGEILFSKALVLCEGETEEQALPLLFKKYFERESFEVGISFIGVGGEGKYLPFLRFACDFSIPVYIFGDGEPPAIKVLKKHYESVYGTTDIQTCPNITVLNGTNFEGYLFASGFEPIIESAIKELDGNDAVQSKIDSHGSFAGRKKTNQSPCPTCNQPIFIDTFRDYQSTNGKKTAMMEILKSCKPKYAPVIAEKLCELEKENLPPKILEFFQKIQNGGII